MIPLCFKPIFDARNSLGFRKDRIDVAQRYTLVGDATIMTTEIASLWVSWCLEMLIVAEIRREKMRAK